MIAVCEPTIRLIFQQGHFGATDTHNTSQLLVIMLLAVSRWGFQQVLGRGYYAQQDTLTPAVIGTVNSRCSPTSSTTSSPNAGRPLGWRLPVPSPWAFIP